MNDTPNVLVPRQLLPQTTRAPLDSNFSAVRIHELALQYWLNRNFIVDYGYPIPVLFCKPMDALSVFTDLWKNENGPFSYLLRLKDANGTPLYEPYPANVRYPIISVKRQRIDYRTEQSYGTRMFRRVSYPTISSNVLQADLGNVTVANRPTAWNYSWQIDHFANRPDTQALFMESVMRSFKHSGGMPETWLSVKYPGYYGAQTCRLRMDGAIEDVSPEEPGEEPASYRTTLSVTLEGYKPDLDVTLWPALWREKVSFNTVNPETLVATYSADLRPVEANASFDELPNLPPKTAP